MNRGLAELLADGGAVVGGAAAMGAVIGYVGGAIVHDFDPSVDPQEWATRMGALGGVFGFVVFVYPSH